MKDPQRGGRWLTQAEHDLQVANYDFQGGFYAAACFDAQQTPEKALNAFLIAMGERVVLGHSVAELIQRCETYESSFAPLRSKAGKLDRFYLPTRHPDSLPGGIPSQVFDKEDGEEALRVAADVVEKTKKLMGEMDDLSD
jgi:HEPN domain-containing protein